MLNSAKTLKLLKQNNFAFITGVPCSIFKNFLVELNAITDFQHTIASSEGEAIGLAAGYHLATSKTPIIYMQNSGLGNAVNPLTSLMSEKVYSIPAILFISWRGEPGIQDEPQHRQMGEITLPLLDNLEIDYIIASPDDDIFAKQVSEMHILTKEKSKPVAIVFKKGIFEKLNQESKTDINIFTREIALEVLLEKVNDGVVITTTGKTSRELFELRKKLGQDSSHDFLTVGSMGCSASIGLGIAQNTDKTTWVIDGDGAVLMKMGTLATIGKYKPQNLIHVVIDNNAYESTGGQPTVSDNLDWEKLFLSCGYNAVKMINNIEELQQLDISHIQMPMAIIVKVKAGSRSDLGRPTSTPIENKASFMKFLAE